MKVNSSGEMVPDTVCMTPPEVIDSPDSNCTNSELEPDLECMNSSSAEDPSRESDGVSVGVAVGAAVAIVVIVTIAIVVLGMVMRKHKLMKDPVSPRRYPTLAILITQILQDLVCKCFPYMQI